MVAFLSDSAFSLLPLSTFPSSHVQVLFSNVRECREVSRSFYSALEERRRESTVCRNVCDIIMDYVSDCCAHPHCYLALDVPYVVVVRKCIQVQGSAFMCVYVHSYFGEL